MSPECAREEVAKLAAGGMAVELVELAGQWYAHASSGAVPSPPWNTASFNINGTAGDNVAWRSHRCRVSSAASASASGAPSRSRSIAPPAAVAGSAWSREARWHAPPSDHE